MKGRYKFIYYSYLKVSKNVSVRGASTKTDSKRESDVFSRLRSFSELTEAEIDASNDSVRGLT